MKNMNNFVSIAFRIPLAGVEFDGSFFNKTRFTNILTPLSRMG